MKLVFRCIYCSEINDLPYRHTDRASLRDECGNVISKYCDNCKKHCIVGINEVKARESKVGAMLFLTSLLLAIALAIWVYLKYAASHFNTALIIAGSICSIPFFISMIYTQSEQQSVRLFNRYYV